jgi:para-nitrobenzyl esterase
MASAQNYSDDQTPGHSNSAREIVNKLLIADGSATNRRQAIEKQRRMDDSTLAKYLRSKNGNDILSAYDTGLMGLPNVPQLLADGTVIPRDPLLKIFSNSENYNAVPIIVGSNRDEFKMMAMSDDELVEMKMGFLPRVKNKARFEAVSAYRNDYIKAKGVDEVAITLQRAQENSVYAYRFDWDELPTILGTDLSELIGAAHASEVPFVFSMFDNSLMSKLLFNEDNIPGRDTLSTRMSSYWAEFAYSSSPGKRLPEWTHWNNDGPHSPKYIIFDDEKDGGIRMTADAITLNVLRQRLLADTSFPDKISRSQMYDCLFKHSVEWDQREFAELGGAECEDELFGF